MPFGQLPVLEIDGKQLAQSIAISRFLARKFGFAGSNPFDEAVVDSIVDQFRDFMVEVRQVIAVASGLQKGDMGKLVKEVFFPARDKFFGLMEKFLRKSQSGYLVGDSLTFADLYLAECSSEFAKKIPQTYDGFPKVILQVKAHADLYSSMFSDDHHDSFVHLEVKKISIIRTGTHYIKRGTSLLLTSSVQEQPNVAPSYCNSNGTCHYDEAQKTTWKQPCLNMPEFDWFVSSGSSEDCGANSSQRRRNTAISSSFYYIAAIFGLLLSL
ncbi:hypothetical protein OESDEN_08679 [Oesophagostomum dentatum]|uniref:glutathione transferase n=1 Tax=Oesophagostomum dentatum TaxID=61180 RepID=A0A0B1T1L6_OESDE|nr:hypothetical protein OESDEN_08679 [Oesophagostomum dentatum]